jgi:hypothetical protein
MKTKDSSRAFIFQALAVVCIAILCVALWKQRADLARITQDYERLRKRSEGLEKDVTQSHAEPGRADAALGQAPTQAPEGVGAQEPRPDAAAPRAQGQTSEPGQRAALQPPAHKPEPEPNKLALAGTEAHPVPGGLVTTMRFSPTKTGPLGLVALAIRLPKGVEARILDLAPVGPATYSDDSKTVSEDGKFAFYQGTLGEETNVQFALSVSGPATADVRGTRGIGAFQLDIQPTGASIRGK